MNGEQNTIQRVISKIPPAWKTPEKGDYTGADGLLYCGECHTAKQVRMPPMLGCPERIVNCLCKCRYDRRIREDEERKLRNEIERLQREGLTDPRYYQYTFAQDDQRIKKFSDCCMRYVQNWEEHEKNGTGILFLGSCGTGKTFYACCIANALIQKGISAMVTSLPTVIRELWNNGSETIARIQRPRLLVLDDLGAERKTDTAIELLYEIIDARYRTGKPMIITTNLTYDNLIKPTGNDKVAAMDLIRIYDRILERCRLFAIDGESRRREYIQPNRREMASVPPAQYEDWNSRPPSYDLDEVNRLITEYQAGGALRRQQTGAEAVV